MRVFTVLNWRITSDLFVLLFRGCSCFAPGCFMISFRKVLLTRVGCWLSKSEFPSPKEREERVSLVTIATPYLKHKHLQLLNRSPIARSISQSIKRSINQSVNQSIKQSINQSTSMVCLCKGETRVPVNAPPWTAWARGVCPNSC